MTSTNRVVITELVFQLRLSGFQRVTVVVLQSAEAILVVKADMESPHTVGKMSSDHGTVTGSIILAHNLVRDKMLRLRGGQRSRISRWSR